MPKFVCTKPSYKVPHKAVLIKSNKRYR